MCGHREYDADFLDKRAFGFPFDRNLDFDLDDNINRYDSWQNEVLTCTLLKGFLRKERLRFCSIK